LGESLEPCLSALLAHNSVLTPGSQRVIEALVNPAKRFLLRHRQPSLVKLAQVAHAEVADIHDHPCIAAFTDCMRESACMLEDKIWIRAGGRLHCVPVDGVVQVDIEIRDHRPTTDSHVRGRRDVGLLDVLYLLDQGLLRSASLAGAQLQCAFIHHDGKGEAGMLFGFRHHQLRSQVRIVRGAVPVDDDAIDPAADHVRNLPVNLCRVV